VDTLKARFIFAFFYIALIIWGGLDKCALTRGQDVPQATSSSVSLIELPMPSAPWGYQSTSASSVISGDGPQVSKPSIEGHERIGINQAPPTYRGWELLRLPPETIPLVSPYRDSESKETNQLATDTEKLLIRPWWIDQTAEKLGNVQSVQHWDLDQMISSALDNSPYIQSTIVETQIYNAKIGENLGPFDASTFVDSIFRDTSDPVGTTLETGTAFSRLNQIGVDNRVGVRKKNFRGGTTELSQELDLLDNNSQFFIPKQQASTKLRLGYTQPLMRGSGLAYNRSTIVIAELAADASEQITVERIQDHVFKISVAYWELVMARAHFRQNNRAIGLLGELRDQLAGRADIDSLQSQLWRADSAIAKLQAAQAGVIAQIIGAEAKLRAAIGSPELRDSHQIELIPMTIPTDWKYDVEMQQELANALQYHPKVQAIKMTLQSIRLKLDVAEQDLRPTLDLVLDGYLRGLNGDYEAAQSWTDQFSEGTPSYSGGLVYQRPVRNYAARAILRERRLELRRSLLEFDQILLNIEAAVVEAASQVDSAYSELESSVQSALAVHAELDYLNERWKDAFRDETQKSFTLDQLLNAHLQLVQAENTWARAQANHMIAQAKLKFATATLLSYREP
jgi:outer membrane protein TolC